MATLIWVNIVLGNGLLLYKINPRMSVNPTKVEIAIVLAKPVNTFSHLRCMVHWSSNGPIVCFASMTFKRNLMSLCWLTNEDAKCKTLSILPIFILQSSVRRYHCFIFSIDYHFRYELFFMLVFVSFLRMPYRYKTNVVCPTVSRSFPPSTAKRTSAEWVKTHQDSQLNISRWGSIILGFWR